MTTYPTINAATRVTGALLTSMLPILVNKTVSTDRAATTAFADDPDLQLPLLANATYFVEWDLICGGLAAADIKTSWNVTAVGGSGLKAVVGPGSAAADANADNIAARMGVHGFTTSVSYNGVRDGTAQLFRVYECANLATTAAGLIAVQWAQVTSNATASRVAAGSLGRATRIG